MEWCRYVTCLSNDPRIIPQNNAKLYSKKKYCSFVVAVVAVILPCRLVVAVISFSISVLLTDVQNVTNLLMYTELPDTSVHQVHPILLRGWYSVLRRVESTGLSLFMSRPVPACRDSRPRRHGELWGDGSPVLLARIYPPELSLVIRVSLIILI